MNRRQFLKVLGIAPAVAAAPQVLQLYTPLAEDPFADSGPSIITLPFRLLFTAQGVEHHAEMMMPCTTGYVYDEAGIGFFPIYRKLHYDIKDDLTIIGAEVDATQIFTRMFSVPPKTQTWTQIPWPSRTFVAAGSTLDFEWKNNPLVSATI